MNEETSPELVAFVVRSGPRYVTEGIVAVTVVVVGALTALHLHGVKSAVAVLAVLICATVSHEVVHAIGWAGCTGRLPRPIFSRGSLGLVGIGCHTARQAVLVLLAPTLLLPIGIGALFFVSSVWRIALTTSLFYLAIASLTDLRFIMQLRRLPSQERLIDGRAGWRRARANEC